MPVLGQETLDDGSIREMEYAQKYALTLPAAGEFPGIMYFDKATGYWSWWTGAVWAAFLYAGDGHSHVKADITDLETIATTPGANKIPLADGAGKIETDWLNFTATGPTYALVHTSFGTGLISFSLLPTLAQDAANAWSAGILNANLADMAAATIKGRQSGGGAGDPEDLTAAQVEAILGIQTTPAASKVLKADGAGKISVGWLPALTNAELDTMAAATIKGRASGAGTGIPTDLSASQVETILGIQTTPAASKVVKADGSGNISASWLANNTVPVTKLSNPSPSSVMTSGISGGATWGQAIIGTQAVVARKGNLDDIASLGISTQSVLGRAAGDIGNLTAANDSLLAKLGSGNLAFASIAASRWVGRLASGDLGAQTMASMLAELMGSLAGTSFPGSPVDGQPFFRTDHRLSYHYSSAASGWLSDTQWSFEFGNNVDLTGAALYKFNELSAFAVMSATLGYPIDFQFKVTGMLVCMASSGTVNIVAANGATAITGSDLALSSQQSKCDMGILSNAVSAGALLTVGQTTGTLKGVARGKVFIRRFET